MARISYVEKEAASSDIKGIYEQLEQRFGAVPNLVKGLANSPTIFPALMPLIRSILGPNSLDPQLKELAILTTTKLNLCSYCTTQHTAMGQKVGLPIEKIAELPEVSDIFDEREKAVIRFAREVTENVAASEESISALRKYFDETQIVELNLTIGTFNLLTRFADTIKIDLES